MIYDNEPGDPAQAAVFRSQVAAAYNLAIDEAQAKIIPIIVGRGANLDGVTAVVKALTNLKVVNNG